MICLGREGEGARGRGHGGDMRWNWMLGNEVICAGRKREMEEEEKSRLYIAEGVGCYW